MPGLRARLQLPKESFEVMEYLLNHLLTNSAARFPDNESVRFEGTALTYRQLDQLTNQLARALEAAGVRRGDRVGIYINKSLASIISIFGILKAGAVYVPLDPNAPVNRLAYITRNCDIRVLLTSAKRLASVPEFFLEEGTPVQAVILTEEASDITVALPNNVELIQWKTVLSNPDTAAPSNGTIETDLAYILYTSGSTGQPKGVMISHRTIFTFINWCQDTFRLSSEDRVTSHAPLHFDLSTFDLYATMKAGGTIVLVPEHLSTLPSQLAEFLENERITITYMVPSILSLMVSFGSLSKRNFAHLRAILFAGEVFPIKYLRRLVAAIPHPEYYNLYGPTETNVCTYYKVQPQDTAPGNGDVPLPIGVACENMEVFAVAEDGRVVTEPGMEGELWARGSCVAQGYWGDAEKTARSFVPNPFQKACREIAYKTGDIVKLHEDRRNWIYVGRRDHMIKTRGYRVELGEIETALYKHEEVKEAAVVAIPDDILGSRLRAFAVLAEGSTLKSKELEVFCAKLVPKYMVPESFEFCQELPKTSTGKIDRTALARGKRPGEKGAVAAASREAVASV